METLTATNIFLVDDNISFCEALRFCFDMHSEFNLKIYNDAMCFLNEFDNKKSGFLLMDLLMPNIDGIALLEELRRLNNKMYTIVISGHADKITAEKVKQLGANEFLSKPFDILSLLNRIRSINLDSNK